MEESGDREGKLTEWLSGRRFVVIDLSKTAIEKIMNIGPFKATLFYREIQKNAFDATKQDIQQLFVKQAHLTENQVQQWYLRLSSRHQR